jgi:ketosteroid isomerase-like protein
MHLDPFNATVRGAACVDGLNCRARSILGAGLKRCRAHGAGLLFGAALALSACATPQPAPSAGQTDASERFARYVSVVETAGAALRARSLTQEERALAEAEFSFAADARARGNPAAFPPMFLPDGKLFPPGGVMAVGPEAVARVFAGDTDDLRWAPAEVELRGDLGVTWGPWALLTKDAQGRPFAQRGRFVTVWKKDPAGQWRIWIDIGNAGPLTPDPPAPPQ